MDCKPLTFTVFAKSKGTIRLCYWETGKGENIKFIIKYSSYDAVLDVILRLVKDDIERGHEVKLKRWRWHMKQILKDSGLDENVNKKSKFCQTVAM